MVADRVKTLREQQCMTQSELARQLGITRSSVNAWEMGISVPSTQYIVELADIFNDKNPAASFSSDAAGFVIRFLYQSLIGS